MSLRCGEMHFVLTQFQRRRAQSARSYRLTSCTPEQATTSINNATDFHKLRHVCWADTSVRLYNTGIPFMHWWHKRSNEQPEMLQWGYPVHNPNFYRMTTGRNMNGILPSSTTDNRSQWPRGLRRGSAAARLLRLWVRRKKIPPGSWMSVSVSVVCCQVEVSATSRSLIQRSPTDCGVSYVI